MQTNVKKWFGAVLVSLSSISAVYAADGAWNVQAGGYWSGSANWLDGIIAGGTGATAFFTNAPGSEASCPVVWVDQPVTLNRIWTWHGGGSEMTFAPFLLPDGSGYYAIDMGTSGFTLHSSRPISFKTALTGEGTVVMKDVGTLIFRNRQPFTSVLELQDLDGYKGLGYESYADSTNVVTGDLLATKTVRLTNSGRLKMYGRYPRPASTGRSWELCAGERRITLLDIDGDTQTFLSPGQTVTGEHIREGTFVALMPDSKTVYLSQAVDDTLTGTATQTLAFAAAPQWETVQRLDTLNIDSYGSCGVYFNSCVADGYGTNIVMLHVGEVTGKYPLSVGSHTGSGGWDGRLAIDRAEAFVGPLRLWGQVALVLNDQNAIPQEPAAGAAFWVDASQAATLTKDSAGAVSRWEDVRGAGYPAAVTWLDAPVYTANALNGLPVLDFGAQGSERSLQWDREIGGIQTVFWVIGSQEGGGSLLGRKPGWTGKSFQRGFDALKGGTAYLGRENGLIGINEGTGEYLWANGQVVQMPGTGLSGEFDMVAAAVNTNNNFTASAFGRLDGASARYNGGQQLAEVIVYTNALTAQQIQDTQAYLYKKWFNRELTGYGAGKAAAVTVESGADARLMQGGEQPVEVKNLSPSGNLTVTAGSEVSMHANAALPKLTLEGGAKAVLRTRKIPAAPALAGNILWLDASREEDFTFGAGAAEVAAWHNRGGGSVQAVTPGPVRPVRVQDGQGRWLVDMGERDNGCCLMALTNLMTSSAFWVWSSRADGTHPLGSLQRNYSGHGEFRNDVSRSSGDALFYRSSRTAMNGLWHKDALPIVPDTTTIPLDQMMLISGTMQGWGMRVSALGGYDFHPESSATYAGSGGMLLAEVLLYNRTLTETERRDVEAYLMKKWFGTVLAGYAGEGGACPMAEVAVNGDAEIEISGDAPVRIGKVSGSGTLTVSGSAPALIDEAQAQVEQTAMAGLSVTPADGAPNRPADGPVMHFDASVPESVTTVESGGVTYATGWRDQVAGVETEVAFSGNNPVYKPNAANGLPVIDFGGRASYLGYRWAPMRTDIRTVFWLFKNEKATGGGHLLGTTNTVYNDSNFARGSNGMDFGDSSLFHNSRSSAAVRNGRIFIDGEKKLHTDVPKWDYQVISVVTTGDTAANQIAADREVWKNSGGMELGELIIYNRPLSPGECAATEDYLMSKWLARRSARSVYTNTLGIVDSSTVAPVRLMEVDGQPGDVGAFRGDGQVVIDSAEVTVWSDSETFSGSVVLRNGSTVTLKSDMFAAAEWIIEAGSVLDLNGQTVTVAGIGGSGCVSNGTLVVSRVAPGVEGAPGTLTVHGGLTLADGAVITVNYDRPNHDALQVTGLLTVAGGGTVELETPTLLHPGFSVPLISYGAVDGVSRLLTDWGFSGDYPQGSYVFALKHVEEDNLVFYTGYAKGTLISVR